MPDGLVIGEIGGSSSRWAWLHADACRLLPTEGRAIPGFNPLNGDADAFVEGATACFMEMCPEMREASRVIVYGAGCGDSERSERMRGVLQRIWPGAGVRVESDLMGAAHGLFGTAHGLVIILGTGMNAGYFDGERLHRPMPSLGFILGDEGSGADIGRHLLQDACYGRMPSHVRERLFGPGGPDLPAVLDALHRGPFPARSLAAHTAALAGLLDESYVRELVLSRFHAFAELLVAFFGREQRATVHAAGSVAWGFREVLAQCLADHGMALATVERDPLKGLVEHHRPAGRVP